MSEALTWRDLLLELTEEQIADLADREARNLFAATLLTAARVMARSNALQVLHADIAVPKDAVEVDDWASEGAEPASRMFTMGYRREVGDLAVELLGIQYSDGRVERSILTHPDGERLNAAQARAFARLLDAAAEELDRHHP